MGKLFEILIRDRSHKQAEKNRLLSDFQYGFRTGRSTEDAAKKVWSFAKFANEGSYGRKDYWALLALDIENAFNTARWNKIVEAMVRKDFTELPYRDGPGLSSEQMGKNRQRKMSYTCCG